MGNSRGFLRILIIIVTTVVIILGGGIYFVSRYLPPSSFLAPKYQKLSPKSALEEQQLTQIPRSQDWPTLWGPPRRDCPDNSNAKYEATPIMLENILYVEPMGELKETHIAPGDHAGIDYFTSPTSKPVKVYAPADGVIVRVERHPYTPPTGYPKNIQHYHVYIMHSCTFFTGFVHLTEFEPAILATSPELKKLSQESINQFQNILVDVPLKAGQALGTTWSWGLLGWVAVDLNVINQGFAKPESYKSENWKIHAVGPFDYFTEPLKSEILAKNPRTTLPRGGRIDFDNPGKASGNWFLEESGGYRDDRQCPPPCSYWKNHLALVYDYIDPTALRVSIGFNTGFRERTPYGVRGNGPDFKNISAEDGLVKYELIGLKDITAERGWPITEDPLIEINDETNFLGTALIQLIDDQKLKFEIFPNKTKEQISGFTANARIYTR